MPDNETDGRVVLFNSSAQKIVASPSMIVKGVEQAGVKIELAPHETKELLLRDLLGKDDVWSLTGSVTLRYSGLPHALQPTLLIENKRTGFLLSPTFNARHDQQTNQPTTWLFPHVAIAGSSDSSLRDDSRLRAFALLSNPNSSASVPQIVVYSGEGTSGESAGHGKQKSTSLPIAPLAPLETRLVDVSQFVDTELIPSSVSHFALGVTYDGAPGDLGITIFSTSAEKEVVLKSEGIILPSGVVESGFWDTANDIGVQPKVENASGEGAAARATLYYQSSFGVESYRLPVLQVPENGSAVLNLKQAIHSRIPDENGNVFPAGVTSGILTLAGVDGNGTASSEITAECNNECGQMSAASQAFEVAASNAMLRITDGATAIGAACTPVCAVPTNFRQVGNAINSNGNMIINYAWDSSTGKLTDLSNVTIGERVDYPAVNCGNFKFCWPSPPWALSALAAQPSIIDGSGAFGSFHDTHDANEFLKPYRAASFTAKQIYRYQTSCANGGNPVTLRGPMDIVRSVSQKPDGQWKYQITKDGNTISIDPLP
ncbi:MAG: hypothetical protein ACRD63_01920 [Pyrinomonadaceae bacterium]